MVERPYTINGRPAKVGTVRTAKIEAPATVKIVLGHGQARLTCRGKTASGAACSRVSDEGSHFCWQHGAPKADAEEGRFERGTQ